MTASFMTANEVEDTSMDLVGTWVFGDEGVYNIYKNTFQRELKDETTAEFGNIVFTSDGTFYGKTGRFRHRTPSPNHVNHDNYFYEYDYNGTYELDGNTITLRGLVTYREIHKALGNKRGAKPATVKNETSDRSPVEIVELNLSRNSMGFVRSFTYASGGRSYIFPDQVYIKN